MSLHKWDAPQRFVRTTDCLIARAYLATFRERGGLLAFLFHSLFRDEREIALNQVDPLQRTTVGQFRRFIEYYEGEVPRTENEPPSRTNPR